MKSLLLAVAAAAAFTTQPVRADDPAIPDAAFPASRYEVLWTKSPFSVATSEASGGESSPDYFLVGIANVEGISYASVVERQHQEHFVISTDKPTRDLTLTSINRGKEAADTYAIVQKNGQPITLKLEQQPLAAATPGPNMPATNAPPGLPGIITPPLPMPGAGLSQPGSMRPPITRFRRPPINLPPRPNQQDQPAPAQPASTQPAPTPAK